MARSNLFGTQRFGTTRFGTTTPRIDLTYGQSQSATISSRVVSITLSSTQGQTGSITRQVIRKPTATQAQTGAIVAARAISVTGTQAQIGTLSNISRTAGIKCVQSNTGSGNVSSSNPTVVLGAAPTQNNLLVAMVWSGSLSGGSTQTANTGWTQLTVEHPQVAVTGALYWKVAGASESATQVPATISGLTSDWAVVMAEYYGIVTSSPVLTEAAGIHGTPTTTHTAGPRTPTAGYNALVVCAAGTVNNTATWSAETVSGTGMGTVTERGEAIASGQGDCVLWDAFTSLNTSTSGSYSGTATSSISVIDSTHIAIFQGAGLLNTASFFRGTQPQSGSITTNIIRAVVKSGTQAQAGTFAPKTISHSLLGSQAQAGTTVRAITRPPLVGTQAQPGSAVRQVNIPRAGTQGQAGSLSRSVKPVKSGTQGETGTISRIRAVALSGTQAQTGTTVRSASHPLAGTQTETGSLSRSVKPTRSGTQAQAGTTTFTVTRVRALAGTQAQAGSGQHIVTHVVTGTQTEAGIQLHQDAHTLSTTQGQTGTNTRTVAHALASTQAQSGSLTRQVKHLLAGTQGQSGSIVFNVTRVRAVAGTQAQSGSIVRSVGHPLSGTQAQVGSISHSVSKLLSGTQAQSGTNKRTVSIVKTSTQAQAGTVSRTVSHSLGGTQAQAGSISRSVRPIRSGTQAQSGATSFVITRVISRSGTQAQAGSATHRVSINLSGTQAQAGSLTHSRGISVSGTQGQANTLTKRVNHSLSASQAQAGSLVKRVNRALSASQSQIGSLIKRVNHLLSGTQGQAGTVSLSVTRVRSVSGTQGQSGTTSHLAAHRLSGTQGQSGSISFAVFFMHPIALSGTQAQGRMPALRFGTFRFGTSRFGERDRPTHRVVNHTLSATQAQSGSLVKAPIRGVALAGTQATSTSLRRTVEEVLTAVQDQLCTLNYIHHSTIITTILVVDRPITTSLIEKYTYNNTLIETNPLSTILTEVPVLVPVVSLPATIVLTPQNLNDITTSIVERDIWGLSVSQINDISLVIAAARETSLGLEEVPKPVASSIIENNRIEVSIHE
jgi:epidermal growth factor receptor substrate 15